MRRFIAITLLCAALLGIFSACAAEPKEINAEAVFQHLLTDITYDTDLVDAGDLSSVYFTGLPAGATVKLHVSSTGYFPDEAALITLADEKDYDAAKTVIDEHIRQIRDQFTNYIPEELPKIDAATTRQFGKYVFVVIAPDANQVKTVLDKADTYTVATTATTQTPTTQTPTTEAPTTQAPTTQAPTTEPAPQIPELVSTSGTYFTYKNGFIRVDDHAFEAYGYNDTSAGVYADLINTTASILAGQTNVYCMPIPTAISVVLPDDIKAIYPKACDQGANIDQVISKFNSNVTGINCHGNLLLHRDEYLYYRTDYHWNGPAAYYAYESFCQAKGFTPYTMEQREVSEFDGFLGALYFNHSNTDPVLAANPDTVIAYHPYSKSATMFYIDKAGNKVDYPIIQNVSGWKAGAKYLCYAGADQPYAEFHNPEVTDGSSLILVKESFGNVLLSYLVDHYSVIYEIDYRYWKGDLTEFAQEVGATDLLFANNITMICTGTSVGVLGSILP